MQLHSDCTEGGLYVKKFPTRFLKLLFVDYNQRKQSLQIQIVCPDFRCNFWTFGTAN